MYTQHKDTATSSESEERIYAQTRTGVRHSIGGPPLTCQTKLPPAQHRREPLVLAISSFPSTANLVPPPPPPRPPRRPAKSNKATAHRRCVPVPSVGSSLGGEQDQADSCATNGGFLVRAAAAAAAAASSRLLLRGDPPEVGLVRRGPRRRQPHPLRLLRLPLHHPLERRGLHTQVQEHGDQPVELHTVGAGQEGLHRPRLLREGPHGRQQRHARLVLRLRRQGPRQAVLPPRQEPRGRHPQRRPPHPGQEQDRHRLPLRQALPGLRAQHRPPAAVPHLLRRVRGRPPFLRRLHHPDAPRHGLPLLQVRLRVGVERRRRVRRGGVPDQEVARAAVHDGVGGAAAHGHDGGALLPAAGPLLVLRPHGRPGAGLPRRHRGGHPRIPAQRGRAQQHRGAQGHRHRHPLHGMPPGDGGAGAAGQDVQGAAVLELVPPQHREGGHPAGHGQRLPRPHHRQGGERVHRLLRRLRRRLDHGRRSIRVQALLRGRRRLNLPPSCMVSVHPGQRRAIAFAHREREEPFRS